MGGECGTGRGGTDLRPVSGLPLWTEKLVAGLAGQLVPLAALALVAVGLGCFPARRPSSASAAPAALGALQHKSMSIWECEQATYDTIWTANTRKICRPPTSDHGEYSQPPGLQSPWQPSLLSGLC